MYPNLLAPLLIALALALAALVLVTARQPVSRRLAFRQLARRRTEAALRRLDLAMTLVGSPRIIFLDEPTTRAHATTCGASSAASPPTA